VVLELGAMLDEGCEPAAACDEFIDDDEFLGRAVTGGVRLRLSIAAAKAYKVLAWILEEGAARVRQSRCM
jgi:hypothetical protein